MDNVSPRGSKRASEESRSGEDARKEREHKSTTTYAKEKGEEVVEVDGDAIAIRGDVEACKRNEVMPPKITVPKVGQDSVRLVAKLWRRCAFVVYGACVDSWSKTPHPAQGTGGNGGWIRRDVVLTLPKSCITVAPRIK